MRNGHLGRRRLFALGGAAALGAVLGACDAPGENPGESPRESPGEGPRSTRPATTDRPQITQWYHAYGEAGTERAVRRYASAYRPADVQVTWADAGGYDAATVAALEKGRGPDVFEFPNGPTIDMIRGRQVVPLTDLLGGSENDFQQSVLGRMSWQGEVYGLPQVVDVQVLVYRPSLLDAAGVDPPRSMPALVDAARALTREGRKGIFLGNDGGVRLMAGPLLWSAGLDYLTDDDKVGFVDPRAGTAYGSLRELWTSGSVLVDSAQEWPQPAALVHGLSAMQFTGLWTLPDLHDALGDDVGVLPWPALDAEGNPSVPIGAYGCCVNTRSSEVGAAKAFVRWLWVDQDAYQLDFATAYGFHIPSRESLIRRATTLDTGPAAEAARFAVDYGYAQTPMLWTPASESALVSAIGRIVHEGADPMTELRAAGSTVSSELKRTLN